MHKANTDKTQPIENGMAEMTLERETKRGPETESAVLRLNLLDDRPLSNALPGSCGTPQANPLLHTAAGQGRYNPS
jgi:hypothetical protein